MPAEAARLSKIDRGGAADKTAAEAQIGLTYIHSHCIDVKALDYTMAKQIGLWTSNFHALVNK